MKNPIRHPMIRGAVCALAVTALSAYVGKATPYASSITNNGSGVMSFFLNESGGIVTITYEDGSTNANYNGLTTGVNLAKGAYTFALGAHTSYSIAVSKSGTGSPNVTSSAGGFTPRGVDVNKNLGSPYFGRIYVAQSGAGLREYDPDMTQTGLAAGNQTAGVTWNTPYRIAVAPDDFLMVGDYSSAHSGVWRLDPNLQTNQLFLGPVGLSAGLAAGSHGSSESRPLITGSLANSDCVLWIVDGDLQNAFGNYNTLFNYSITNGPLPWTNPPTLNDGPVINVSIPSIADGISFFAGLTQGPPPYNYFYATCERANLSNPNVQIYDSTGTNFLWSSYNNAQATGGTSDLFITAGSGAVTDGAVSPDGSFFAAMSIANNQVILVSLTNGIPDISTLIVVPNPGGTVGNGRGFAWDLADNFYTTSSGLALLQQWSLGQPVVATTTGNASGATGLTMVSPSAKVSVVATTPFASQGGSDGVVGTPVSGVFTITRSDTNNADLANPLNVEFSLTGTAPAAAYTCIPPSVVPAGSNDFVTIPAGQTTATVTIVPTTANVPRPTTTVILSIIGTGSYRTTPPTSDTVQIQNTSTNQLVLAVAAPTMYKAFSNDYASITLTRLGDTNAPAYTVQPSDFIYSANTALPNIDFTPMAAVTFNPGDIVHTATISPLSNGVPPVDTINPLYVGNKSVTVGLAGDAGYGSTAATATLTLIDNAEQPNPVLFADPLTDPNDAVHWNITYGTANEPAQPANYDVEFGYDLTSNNPESANNGLIGLPPNGATNALRITCNKQNPSTTYGGGVNVYYTSQAFSGNYAVRFNMNLVEGSISAFSVEGAMFGINHNGHETNWWLGSGVTYTNSGPWAADGVWYWIQAPPGSEGGFDEIEYEEYTGIAPPSSTNDTGWINLNNVAATSFENVFKNAVFTAPGGDGSGTPANNSPTLPNPLDNSWSDVEIKQVNNLVSLSIDKTLIFTYLNTNKSSSLSTNGYIMFGYDCPIQGAFQQYVGGPDAAVYFSNLKVVSIAGPVITSVADSLSGTTNNVTIQFTSTDGDDTPASFTVQSTPSLLAPVIWSNVASAVITQIPTGNGTELFQATTSSTNKALFYRIKHN